MQTVMTYFNDRQTHRQRKPPRPGAAGVEIEDAVFAFHKGGVGMAEDDRGEACRGGVQVQGEEFVEDVDKDAVDLDDPGMGQIRGPGAPVGVAPDGVHRRDLRQGLQYLGITDVPGVNDQLDTGQGGGGLGAQQAVGVGDDADQVFRQ